MSAATGATQVGFVPDARNRILFRSVEPEIEIPMQCIV